MYTYIHLYVFIYYKYIYYIIHINTYVFPPYNSHFKPLITMNYMDFKHMNIHTKKYFKI